MIITRSWVNTILLILGIIPLLSGISGLIGWTIDKEFLASISPGLIPMAASTAVLFIILSIVYIVHLHGVNKPIPLTITGIFTFLVIVIALTLFVLSLFNIQSDIELLGLSVTSGYTNSDVGHMSPVSTLLFSTLGISFMMDRPAIDRLPGGFILFLHHHQR